MLSKRLTMTAIGLAITALISGSKSYADTLTVTSVADDGSPGTLRETIDRARPGDTIDFHQSLNGQRILLTNPMVLGLNKNLTITAATLPNGITIDGSGGYPRPVLVVTSGVNASLDNLTLTGGTEGGIIAQSNLTINNCRVIRNIALYGTAAGGITCDDGTVNIIHSIISENLSRDSSAAAGIAKRRGSLLITDSTISSNTNENGSLEAASAIFSGANLTLARCELTRNSGSVRLPVVRFARNAEVADCIFSNNRGSAAIYVEHVDAGPYSTMVRHSTFTENQCRGVEHEYASQYRPDPITLEECIFYKNEQLPIYNTGGPMQIRRCWIASNELSAAGAIYNNGGFMRVEDTTVSDNVGHRAGGILVESYPNMQTNVELIRTTLDHNRSINGAGGMLIVSYGEPISVTTNNCTFSSNSSKDGAGGGIYWAAAPGSVGRFVATTIVDNYARQGGGIFVGSRSRLEMSNCLVANNFSSTELSHDVDGSPVSRGYNLIGRLDGSAGWVETDLTGTIEEPLDPLLSPLDEHGGWTLTHALLKGSPAINAGDPRLANTEDQRGVMRDNTPDIGAYEASGRWPIRSLYHGHVEINR